MLRRRVCVTLSLGFILICLQVGPAKPGILEKASQLISLVATQANPIPLSNFLRRLPNGEAVAYTLPANTAFVLTKLSWNFTATTPGLNDDVLLTVGNYYRFRVTMNNSYCGASDGLASGVPITNMSQTVKVSLFGDASQTPIPGTLSIRLVGYTAPNQ